MKRKREERRKRRRLKLKTLFLLSLTLIFNTYAWFLYVTTVSTNMTVHVDAWSVNFEVGDQVIENNFVLEIDHAYPGMDEVEKTVTVNNSGEKDATLSYVITTARIFDDIYIVEEELSTEEKENLTGTEIKMTAEELAQMLLEDFPFEITVNVSSTDLAMNGGEATINVKFTWAYESGDDELDTQYGVDSYKYYQQNTGKSAIEIKIKLKAEQKNA
mgnify:CR=1 FL=1